MRIVFMGTPAFACPALAALHSAGYSIPLVVTGTDKRGRRGGALTPTAVKAKAVELGLPVYTPSSLKTDDVYESIKDAAPDLIVVIAFKILPQRLFTLPRFGSINVHGSLLPKYRGAAPINWAIINGEKETGLTSFFLKPTVDTGDIIHRKLIMIDENETFGELYNRMSELSAPFVLETVKMIESGNVIAMPQVEAQATAAPKIHPQDTIINFNKFTVQVHNFVRGLSPYPGAVTTFRDKRIKVLRTALSSVVKKPNQTPGEIVVEQDNLFVVCIDGLLQIDSLLPEGKKEISAKEFIHGYIPDTREARFGQSMKGGERED